MLKNVASQKLIVFAFDTTNNTAKTGDAANLTAYVSKDYGAVTVLGDTSATEMDSTNAKGYYLFDLTQAETNADALLFSAKSSTANIAVIGVPARVDTFPTTGILAPATAGRTLVVDAAGLADANTVKLGPSGSGTAQTARDIGASVLLSSGTATGQLKLASGYVAMTWADIAAPTTSVNLSGTTIATTQKVDVDTIKTNPVVNAGTITFPTTATLASTTNITAGTIATVTNLTNAPTNGDLTATMKTSVTTAATAATPIAASVTGAVGSVTGNVGGNVTGSVGSLGATAKTDVSTAVLTTAMTESYAADGAAPTLAQAQFLLTALLSESSISSTTLTAKKLDGSTTAATFTLNSATVPTSITRAS